MLAVVVVRERLHPWGELVLGLGLMTGLVLWRQSVTLRRRGELVRRGSTDLLLRRADEAMYECKRARKVPAAPTGSGLIVESHIRCLIRAVPFR